MIDVSERLLDFGIGGILGSFLELSHGIEKGKFSKFRPIYGVGTALAHREGSFLERFIYNFCTAVMVEYFGSIIFDPNKELWNYEYKRYHFKGRVCLDYALLFALGMTTYSYLPKEVKLTYFSSCAIMHTTRLIFDESKLGLV